MLIKLNGRYFILSQKGSYFLLVENMHIERENATKSLSEFIDKNLSWKEHMDIVSSKNYKNIGIPYKSRDVLRKQCLKQLYFFAHS